MRILYVTYRESLLGGASLGVIQTQVRDLLSVLARENEVRWLAVVGAEARDDDAPVADVVVHRLPSEAALSSRWHAIRAVRREVRRFRPDVVHARSYNATLVVTAARTGVPVVFDPRSLMPDERVGYLGMDSRSMRSRAWRAAERYLVRHTSATVGVSPPMTEQLARHARGLARSPALTTIPLAADPRRLMPSTEQRGEVRRALGVGDDEVLVVYAGSLRAADPAYLVAQLARIHAGTPRARFLLLSADDCAVVERHAAHAGLEGLQARCASYDEMPGYLAAADWGLIARKPATVPVLNRIELTTKFVEYLCAGLPVLVGRTSLWLADLVEAYGLGLAAEPATTPIELTVSNARQRGRIAAFGAAEYDVEVVARSYRTLYERITSGA